MLGILGRSKKKGSFKLFNPKLFFRWAWKVILFVVIADVAYLFSIWPNWDELAEGPVPQSAFIKKYVDAQSQNNQWPKLRWAPVTYAEIPDQMVRAVVVAEDARFFSHVGVDMEAVKEVMKYNLSKRRFIFGGSTISQQTVKNLFLSPSRNPLRKWHELIITLGMERNLSKHRIMELYLNVAEFGRGVYGVNAASLYYWGVSSSRLDVVQSVELAASLPAPVKHNPKTRTKYFLNKVKKISQYF